MKEFQDSEYYQPTVSSMQELENQLKKSSTSNGVSSHGILGKFLKLGKSKSDVHNYVKRRQAATSAADQLEDDFVLAPVQLRGVEKMVHRATTAKKENVSRSHSWIYGSVKLPSDLPFGYGYEGSSPSNPNSGSRSQPPPEHSGTSHPHHMQIPRCQAGDYYTCSCDAEYYNFIAGPSLQGSKKHLAGSNCEACRLSQLVPNRKSNLPVPPSYPDSSKKFGSSVRKLTWKSLKQAVKKRPSLDSITNRRQAEGVGKEYPNYGLQDDFSKIPTTSYFFPEKKSSNFYASCTDLFGGEGPHITASVRLRPKRSRSTWNFPNEFGPIPNYQQEEDGMYHSEWDLRQCMPYEQWITSSNPQNDTLLEDIFSSTVSSVKITSNNNGFNKRVNKPSNNDGKTNVNHHNGNGKGGQSNSNSSELYTNGGVKRFSILQSNNESSAYELNKGEEDEESDEESMKVGSNLLTDDPVRIAGQGIFMVPGMSNGLSAGKQVKRSNSTSSTKYKNNSSFGSNRGNHPHHLLLSSTRSEADGIWSDTQIPDEPLAVQKDLSAPTSQSSRDRHQVVHQDKAEGKGLIDQKVQLKTFKQLQQSKQSVNQGVSRSTPGEGNGSSSMTSIKSVEVQSNSNDGGENESHYAKNGTSHPNNGKPNVIKSGKKGTPSGDSDGKYGALRRRRGRSTTGRNNLLRETIYEEESEHLEYQDETHSVKIVVSQIGTLDYVKPILKTRIATGGESDNGTEVIYDEASLEVLKSNRSPKKVQFNATEEIVVCSGESADSDSFEENENEEDEEILGGDPIEKATDMSGISSNHDHDSNVHVNRLDDHGAETKSGSSMNSQEITRESSARKEISIGKTTSESHQKQSSPVKNEEEVPHFSQVKVVHEKNSTSTNEVNNLQSNSGNQNLSQNDQGWEPLPISMNGAALPSEYKSEPTQTKSKPYIVEDGKVFQSKLKKSKESTGTEGMAKAERIHQNADRHQFPGNDKDSELQKIINPNSLLFNDTTRIRLNQSRPSVENTFKLADTGKGTLGHSVGNSARKIRPSQSFRSSSTVSGGLRPKDPPPPPPRVSSVQGLNIPKKGPISTGSRANKLQISLPIPMLGFSTTNDLVKEPKVAPSHYQNGSIGRGRSKSLTEKCEAIEKVLSQHPSSNGIISPLKNNGTIITPDKPLSDSSKVPSKVSHSQNVEILTKENSVSEIRIYSGPKGEKPLPAPKRPDLASRREMHYAASDLFQRPGKRSEPSTSLSQKNSEESAISRPQSTSVVLIIDTSTTDVTGNSIMTNQNVRLSGSSLHPTDQIQGSLPPPLPPMNGRNSQNEDKLSSVGQQLKGNERQVESRHEPLYDDVINNRSSVVKKNFNEKRHSVPRISDELKPPASPPPLPPCSSIEKCKGDNFSLQSVYSDVGNSMTVSMENSQEPSELIYDDTLSSSSTIIESVRTKDGSKPLSKCPLPSLINHSSSDESTDTLVEEEPLYDDVLNVMNATTNHCDSDSGTETDIPPPLPNSGPPVHLLPEISLELPLIPVPTLPALTKSSKGSISKGTNRLLGEIIEFSKKISGRGSGIDSTRETLGDLGESGKEGSLYPLNHSVASDPIRTSPSPPPTASTSDSSPIKRRPLFLVDVPEENPHNMLGSDDVLDRTRTLLNELNEKLATLNFSPEDYSTSISKVLISSSSESSGVEEDYNSEKNYSLSNDESGASSTSVDENYKLSKLVTETISMARGKFLDSMKIIHGNSGMPSTNDQRLNSVDGSDSEEPIYEEINDQTVLTTTSTAANILRCTSPVYADAFDAKSIFDGASRNEILSFLESIRDRLTAVDVNPNGTHPVKAGCGKRSKKNSEIERNDSGIGSESSLIVALPNNGLNGTQCSQICKDCNDTPAEAQAQDGNQDENPISNDLCLSCSRKRNERKEIVQEIYETELKYGRDLRIIVDEFYNPIQTAGLLSKDQLDQIFLNVDQLIDTNVMLSSSLKSAITSAIRAASPDEDLNSVNVGRIFLEIGEKMMSAFEIYCTRQANAGALLTQIEKEKELLRIFLRVSQMENTVLRRMNLPAFLMVPVQRVTRYPLLLARLLKVTAADHPTRDELQLAHEKIEQHLEHMNKSAREVASVKLWRRISIINGNGSSPNSSNGVSSTSPVNRRSGTEFDGASVRIKKMALDILDWAGFKDVSCVIESQMNLVQGSGKTVRNIYAVLLARGTDLEGIALKMDQEMFFPPKDGFVKDVKLVLVRAKNARFGLVREPLCLAKCVVSKGEAELQDCIEINEMTSKNTYHLQGMDRESTSLWLKLLQCHAVCVGKWRRRRGALANIMMHGMMRHL